MNKKITIIVPVYNAENYVEKCLRSIINQTYKNLEIIVLNDGSTDSSLKKIQHIAKEDSRLVVIDKKNTGVSDTRNIGISKASGDYIMFVDSDDELELTAAEDCLKNIKNYDVLRFLSYSVEGGQKTLYPCRYNNFDKDLISSEEMLMDLISGNIPESMFCFFVKTSFLKKHDIKLDVTLNYAEDFFFIIDILQSTKQVKLLNKPLYNYNDVDSSITKESVNQIKNLKNLPRLKEKFLAKFAANINYVNKYNLYLLKKIVFYYSRFQTRNSFRKFRKIMKELHNEILCILNSIDKQLLGKGSKIFVFLVTKRFYLLLYVYLMVFNKLKW